MIAHNVQTFYACGQIQIQQLTQAGIASYYLPSLAIGYVFLVAPDSVILSICQLKKVHITWYQYGRLYPAQNLMCDGQLLVNTPPPRIY